MAWHGTGDSCVGVVWLPVRELHGGYENWVAVRKKSEDEANR